MRLGFTLSPMMLGCVLMACGGDSEAPPAPDPTPPEPPALAEAPAPPGATAQPVAQVDIYAPGTVSPAPERARLPGIIGGNDVVDGVAFSLGGAWVRLAATSDGAELRIQTGLQRLRMGASALELVGPEGVLERFEIRAVALEERRPGERFIYPGALGGGDLVIEIAGETLRRSLRFPAPPAWLAGAPDGAALRWVDNVDAPNADFLAHDGEDTGTVGPPPLRAPGLRELRFDAGGPRDAGRRISRGAWLSLSQAGAIELGAEGRGTLVTALPLDSGDSEAPQRWQFPVSDAVVASEVSLRSEAGGLALEIQGAAGAGELAAYTNTTPSIIRGSGQLSATLRAELGSVAMWVCAGAGLAQCQRLDLAPSSTGTVRCDVTCGTRISQPMADCAACQSFTRLGCGNFGVEASRCLAPDGEAPAGDGDGDGVADAEDPCPEVAGRDCAPADVTPPTLRAEVSPPPDASGWHRGDVRVTFVAEDAGGSGVARTSPPVSVRSEGRDLRVRGYARDHAGNLGSAEVVLQIDRTPPELVLRRTPPPNAEGWINRPATLSFDCIDAVSGVASVSPPQSFEEEGAAQSYSGRCVDVAGHVSTESGTLDLDLTPPQVRIDAPAPGSYHAGARVTVQGVVGADDLSGLSAASLGELMLGEGAFEVDIELLEGRNDIVLQALDVAGNAGTHALTLVRDSKAPSVKIVFPEPGARISEDTVTVLGAINDRSPGAVGAHNITLQINGAPAEVANRQFVRVGLPLELGSNEIRAVATDAAGNVGEATVQVTRVAPEGRQLIVEGGDAQRAMAGSELPEPVRVRLVDAVGAPLPDMDIIFRIVGNDGRVLGPPGAVKSPSERSLAIRSDAEGRAEARWVLGTTAGAGVDRLEVRALGVAAPQLLCASADAGTAARVLPFAGEHQSGEVGQPLAHPFVALISDAAQNPVAGAAVRFEVIEGEGRIDGARVVELDSDVDGLASALLTLGSGPGRDLHRVRVTLVDPALGAEVSRLTFTASAFVAGRPELTSVVGLVLDNFDAPVPEVRVSYAGQPPEPDGALPGTLTDADGSFLLAPVPAGPLVLKVDGPGRFADLSFDMRAIAGVQNALPTPIRLVPLRAGETFDGTRDLSLTLPDVPGFELFIARDTQVTFPIGHEGREISVTQVHYDDAPMAPPNGTSPRIIVTIQPPEVHFDPPARLSIPNESGLAPGAKADLFSFDHQLGQFVIIGPGTITEDGASLRSDPGFGVVSGGWHCGGRPDDQGDSGALDVGLSLGGLGGGPDPLAGQGGDPDDDDPRPPQLSLDPSGDLELVASGEPAEDIRYAWTATGDVIVEAPACVNTSRCVARIRAAPGVVSGEGRVTVRLTSTATGESTTASVDVRLCGKDGAEAQVNLDFDRVAFHVNRLRTLVEAVGCQMACSRRCVTGRACGDSCIQRDLMCTQPPGSACNRGAGPLDLSGEFQATWFDTCCPDCPDEDRVSANASAQLAAGFGLKCPIVGARLPSWVPGNARAGVFLQLNAGLSLQAQASYDGCCTEPPCVCWEGSGGLNFSGCVSAELQVGGDLIALAATGCSGLDGGIELRECDQLCSRMRWGGVKAKVTGRFSLGFIEVSEEFEMTVAGPQDLGESCTDLPALAPADGAMGCPP